MSVFARLAEVRERKIEVVLRAAVRSAEPWFISFWDCGLSRSAAVDLQNPEKSWGRPVSELALSGSQLAAELAEYAPTYVGEKNQSPVILAYARLLKPEEGGHKDKQCRSITGLILDCDAGGDPEKILVALMKAGISFTFSFKPATGKFHIIVQLKEMIVPVDSKDPDRRAYAVYHQALFEHAIRAFSELANVQFDLAMAPILIHIDFPACRKVETDPMPVVEGRDGGALDLESFCKALDFVPPPPPPPRKKVEVEALDATDVSAEELRQYIASRARALTMFGYTQRSWKHGERLEKGLDGKAPCAVGELRNQVWFREIAGTAGVACAQRWPNVETERLAELLAEIFEPARKAQNLQDHAAGMHPSPRDFSQVEDMFARSIRDIRSKEEPMETPSGG